MLIKRWFAIALVVLFVVVGAALILFLPGNDHNPGAQTKTLVEPDTDSQSKSQSLRSEPEPENGAEPQEDQD